MKTQQSTKKNVPVADHLHRLVKAKAAQQGKSIGEVTEAALVSWLAKLGIKISVR